MKEFPSRRHDRVARELVAAFINEKIGKFVAISGGVYHISVQDFLGFYGIC